MGLARQKQRPGILQIETQRIVCFRPPCIKPSGYAGDALWARAIHLQHQMYNRDSSHANRVKQTMFNPARNDFCPMPTRTC